VVNSSEPNFAVFGMCNLKVNREKMYSVLNSRCNPADIVSYRCRKCIKAVPFLKKLFFCLRSKQFEKRSSCDSKVCAIDHSCLNYTVVHILQE